MTLGSTMQRLAALILMGFLSLPASAQHLRIGIASDPDVLDPTLSRSVAGRQVFAAMCDKLVDIDEKLNIVPQLATAWRWDDGGRALVLTLRPDVRFHDGAPLDGEAAAIGLRRQRAQTRSRVGVGLQGKRQVPGLGRQVGEDAGLHGCSRGRQRLAASAVPARLRKSSA